MDAGATTCAFTDYCVLNPDTNELQLRLANIRGNHMYNAHVDCTFVSRSIDECGDVNYSTIDMHLVRHVCTWGVGAWQGCDPACCCTHSLTCLSVIPPLPP